MKRFIAICATALVMTGCVSTPTSALERTSAVVQKPHVVATSFVENIVKKQESFLKMVELQEGTKKIEKVITSLRPHLNKTWYVFSGASPMGWDCSGMTMWAYSQIGLNLEHRASKQQNAGVRVKSPKRGDIVVFTYKGNKSAYHVGIYVGPDKMIHAGKRGERTSLVSISKFAGTYSKVTYRRLVDSL